MNINTHIDILEEMGIIEVHENTKYKVEFTVIKKSLSDTVNKFLYQLIFDDTTPYNKTLISQVRCGDRYTKIF